MLRRQRPSSMPDNIFDYIDSIVVNKQHVDSIKYDETVYSSYMINRWISMIDADSAMIINETTNKWWSQFGDKNDHYEFLLNLMPRRRRQRIEYIKKNKDKNTKADEIEHLSAIAINLQLSQREVSEMINTPT